MLGVASLLPDLKFGDNEVELGPRPAEKFINHMTIQRRTYPITGSVNARGCFTIIDGKEKYVWYKMDSGGNWVLCNKQDFV